MNAVGEPVGQWPLIGREGVLDDTVATLRRRLGSGVVLIGEEGVGKSRLATEVLAQVRSQGVAVVPVVATAAAATLPFGALVDLLPPASQPATSPVELVRLAAARLRSGAPRQGVVLAVDDAHLLDDASAALVAHVVRSGAARCLLVVRDLRPAADALLGLLKDGPCAQVRLPPLGHGELASLCAAVLGGPVEGATLRRLEQLSGGNLLYLHELLDAGLADGTLVQERGVWRSTGAASPTERLAHVVRNRFERLSDAVRGVLELTSLAGSVEVTLLEGLCGLDALVHAERARLVVVSQDGLRMTVRLSHPLYAEVLRDTTPRLAAREHRRRLAEALAATGCRRKDDLLRRVMAQVDSGGQPSEDLLLAAGRTAAQLFDVRLAVRLTAAAAAGGSFEARLAMAEALYACGRADEAEQQLESLQQLADDPVRRGRIALARGSNLVSGFGRAAQAEQLVRRARDELGGGELRDELTALGGMFALTGGRSQQALDEVTPLLARPGPPTRSTVRALLVAMSAWGQVGRAETALAVGQQMLADAPDHELPAVMEVALVGLCYAYGVLGRLDEAETLASARYEAALDQRAPDLRTLWALGLGQAALARGDLLTADAHLREAELLLRHDQSVFGVYSLAWCLGCLAEVAAARGDGDVARATLDEASAATPEPCFIASRELARIWVTWAGASAADACAVAIGVADGAGERGLLVVEAYALHQAARLGYAGEVADRLRALAGRVDGELVDVHAAHAVALADSSAEQLSAASETYERMGVWIDAAEAAAQAAQAHAHAGRPAEATRAAQRSSTLAARCPGSRTPGLALTVAAQPLTDREREIAGLAARGWSTAQIAAALVLSGRTVENHLHRAYSKLGISSRRELSDASIS